MVTSLRKLFDIVTDKEGVFDFRFRSYTFFLILLFIAPFIEMVSFGSILPVISIIAEPESLTGNPYFQQYLPGVYAMEDIQIAKVFVFASLAIFLFRAFIALLTSWKQNAFLRDAQISLSKRLYLSYINKDFSAFQNKKISVYIQNLTSEVSIVINSLLLSISTFLTEALVAMLIGIILFILNPVVVSLAIICWLVFYKVLLTRFNRYLKALGKTRTEYENRYIDIINQSFKSVLEIKIYDARDFFLKNFYESCRKSNEVRFLRMFLRGVPKIVFELIMFAAVLMVLYISISNPAADNAIINLSILAMGIYRLLPSMNRINESINSINYSVESYRLLSAQFDHDAQDVASILPCRLSSEISLADVGYSYSESAPAVFEKINLAIKKNEKVCIIGESGQGKTTLLKILSGLVKPTSGHVLIDGKSCEPGSKQFLSLVSYVPQDPYLFTGTFLENITFTSEPGHIDQAKLDEAVATARIADLMEQFADRKISDLMKNISGGQYQRIGIARALYKDSDIILFDEPTSALDTENTFQIFSRILEMKDKTVICVTHNLELAGRFDRVYEMAGGRLMEYTHEQ